MRIEFLTYKTTFTGQRKPEQTFAYFENYAKATDFSKNIQSFINKDNYISEGAWSKVYSIPDNDKFVIKVRKDIPGQLVIPKDARPEPIDDIFGSLNVGQPIAKYGDDILILIKQDGKEFGIPFRKKGNMSGKYKKQYMNNISMMANINQEGYNNFALEIKKLKKLGLYLDIWNSNNILVNENKNEINIVDIMNLRNLRQRFYARISKTAILRLLIDECYLRQILPKLKDKEKAKIGERIEVISKKLEIAMKNAKLAQLNTLNKFLADFRDLIKPRTETRIDVIIKELILASKNAK